MSSDPQDTKSPPKSKKPKANRRHNTRKYKARPSGIGYATFNQFDKTVIVKRIDPETGEEVVVETFDATRPRSSRRRLDKYM